MVGCRPEATVLHRLQASSGRRMVERRDGEITEGLGEKAPGARLLPKASQASRTLVTHCCRGPVPAWVCHRRSQQAPTGKSAPARQAKLELRTLHEGAGPENAALLVNIRCPHGRRPNAVLACCRCAWDSGCNCQFGYVAIAIVNG